MAESGQFMSGDPAQIANQNGWQGDNFGWYRDNTGKVVARSIGGKMVVYDGDQQQTTPAQTDMGNPAITAGQTPAERARTMGLQSNGKGGYVDDSGQVAARTVNGELVFYDDKGGAISDGAGGQALTQSSPSWVDPDSGLILVPPAQPETPEEKASTPDPLPATPPMGFDLFITQKHKKAKADAQAQRQAEADVQQKEQELADKYSQTPGMQPVYDRAMQIIDMAEKSGDEDKIAGAGILKGFLEDRADDLAEYFAATPEEGHQELGVTALKGSVQEAKYQAMLAKYEDDWRALSNSGEADGLNSTGHSIEDLIPTVLKYNEPKPNTLIKDKKLTVKGKETNWEIHNDGKMKEGAMEAIKKLGGSIPEELNNLDSALENHYEPAQYLDVTWGVIDGAKETTDNRMIALDAMKTWRNDILPNLPVGSVVSATPDVFRKGLSSIYKKAGFGSVGDNNTLNGVVMIVDGKKVMVPISDEMEEEFRLEKYYLNQLNEGISIERELFIAEMAFDDFV
jgi:hypothetical protein